MKEVEPVFRNFPGGSVLSDETQSLSYREIPGLLQSLDTFFEQRVHNLFCLYFPLNNTVQHTVLLMYLVSRNINFFIYSTHSANQTVPEFCDQLLVLEPGDIHNLHQHISLISNAGYVPQQKALDRLSSAVILSSSGTSGPPKYVYYTSAKLVRNAQNCVERFAITGNTKLLVPVPVSHMYGLGVGLLPALLSGSSVHLVEKNNVIKLVDALRNFQPAITLLTPVVCKMLLLIRSKISRAGQYITAGESIGYDAWHEFVSYIGPLTNLYGSTEMGAMATSSPGDQLIPSTIYRCYPLNNISFSISDTGNNEILCKNISGFEFYLDKQGGKATYTAYDNGWYRTRDCGEMHEEAVTVTGRVDNCVNRFGFVVSLREIELQLENTFPQLNEVAVVKMAAEGLTTGLAAICELKKGQSLNSATALLDFRNQAPKHFVPDEIRFMDALPRLGNGKIDREGLRKTITNSIQ